MFEIISSLLVQFVSYLPGLVGLYIVFDLIGGLLFGKR